MEESLDNQRAALLDCPGVDPALADILVGNVSDLLLVNLADLLSKEESDVAMVCNALVEHHSRHEGVCGAGLKALVRIWDSQLGEYGFIRKDIAPDVNAALVLAGSDDARGVEMLLSSMEAHPSVADIQCDACRLLSRLATTGGGESSAFYNGAMRTMYDPDSLRGANAIVAALVRFPENEKVQEAAFGTYSPFQQYGGRIRASSLFDLNLGAANILPVVLPALEQHPANYTIVIEVLTLLYQMDLTEHCTWDDNFESIQPRTLRVRPYLENHPEWRRIAQSAAKTATEQCNDDTYINRALSFLFAGILLNGSS